MRHPVIKKEIKIHWSCGVPEHRHETKDGAQICINSRAKQRDTDEKSILILSELIEEIREGLRSVKQLEIKHDINPSLMMSGCVVNPFSQSKSIYIELHPNSRR